MGKSAPKSPDPKVTAAAQGQWNSFTAQQQQAMNMTGQNSPWGSLSYNQTGTQTIIDPNGKPVQVPMYTANTTLSPQQQAIYNQTQSADLNLAKVANEQSSRIGSLLNDPFKFENSDAQQWAYDLASPRILAQQGKNQAALESQLVNSGIRRGTPQWDSEMTRLTQGNSDQLNQLALTGRSQAFNEALAMRNQPLNEIIGLTSGSQIQNPNATFAATPQSQVAGVDYTGLVQDKYKSDMANYQAKMGGLFGLGSSIIKAKPWTWSDRRMKTNVTRVGALDNGLPVYSYQYVWGGPVHIGVMAQDAEIIKPDSVVYDPSGFMGVDYEKAVA